MQGVYNKSETNSAYFERTEGNYTWAQPFDLSMLPSCIRHYTGANAPSCRNADAPYRADGTDFVLSVDAMLVSANVEVLSSQTISTGFAYSDHDPVKLEFILTDNT